MNEKEVLSSCPHDCGGRCVLKLHVKDGVITRIESDTGEEPQLRACARGRAYRQRVYAPDRLKYPMKRVGERGEGKFERISWDEALDRVAGELQRVKKLYGNDAIFYVPYSGNTGTFLHSQLAVYRLLTMFGGFTPVWGSASFWGNLFASNITYGTLTTGHSREDLLNARLIIMWGWNPAVSIQSTNTPGTFHGHEKPGLTLSPLTRASPTRQPHLPGSGYPSDRAPIPRCWWPWLM